MIAFRLLAIALGLVWLVGCATGQPRPVYRSTPTTRPVFVPTRLPTKLVCKDKGNGKKVCKEKIIGGW